MSSHQFNRSWSVCTPGTETVVWEGESSTADQISAAVAVARNSLAAWRQTSIEDRIEIVKRFAAFAREERDELAAVISGETGKPNWEATAEANLIAAKVDLSIEAHAERSRYLEIELPQGTGAVGFRGLGVMAVLGPFNFPAHLPNGHLVPAILAGNCVVFKPSEMTPGTAEKLLQWWRQAGLPDGVLQIVYGDGQVGKTLIAEDIDGVLFTGSSVAGCAIHRALGGRPNVLVALEMGGNNPIVVHRADDLDAAAYLVTISAYITAGQRCTCARRLIVTDEFVADQLVRRIAELADSLRVGMPDAVPEPFMGPLISPRAADRVIDEQRRLIEQGAKVIRPAERLGDGGALLGPGLIDVTGLDERNDEEIFGPLLQLIRVSDFDAALVEANRTRYGLSASLLSDDAGCFERFSQSIRAGVINWNQPTIGASGRLPFGGLGASGNHRPSGYFAADYCSDATASLRTPVLRRPEPSLPGIDGV